MTEKNSKKIVVGAWWQAGMQLFLRLSAWIVFPILLAIFVGKFLDRAFGTTPWLFLLSVIASFTLSITMIIRIGLREMDKMGNKEKNNQNH